MVNKATTSGKSALRPPAPNSPATRKRRARGRPRTTNSEDVRNRLLTAARDLFLRFGYRAVSSRQIAAAANANVAMIRYYFGGKPGLYREICQGIIQPIRARVDAMTEGNVTVELGALLGMIMRMWASNPWLPGLIVREVLMPDGPLRAMFVREFPERIVPLVTRIVQSEMDRGRIRRDLDPKLVVLSMVSLGLFPFLTLPVSSKVFGVRQEEEFLQSLIRHTTELLAHGCAGPDAAEKTS